MAYAMTVGVRDAQVRERSTARSDKLVERRDQLRVEIERLKTVKYF